MIYQMNDELTKKYTSELLKDGIFELLPAPKTTYEIDGCVISFESKSGIHVGFIQDRGLEVSCRVGIEDYLSPYLEDVLYAIDMKTPKYHDDFLELMQVASKVIIENLDKIEQAFDDEHIKETKRRIESSAILRWRK